MHRLFPICLLMVSLSAEDPAPWLRQLAAVTDPRPTVNGPAIEALARYGEPVLDDLGRLLGDADWQVRARVATVAAAIGGERAAALILTTSTDEVARVREVAAAALGRTPGEGVFDRLGALLRDREPEVRKQAAQGLAVLGDPRALVVLAEQAVEGDATVRDVRRGALEALAARPLSVPAMVEALASTSGTSLHQLILACGVVPDPRLSPALAALVGGPDAVAAPLAARSLAANGDTRCIEALCLVATGTGPLAQRAAETLRVLTGYQTGPGPAWEVWWRERKEAVTGLIPRDVFLASLHDPLLPVSPQKLADFSPEHLMPLVDSALGEGGAWWSARAMQVLLADTPARWTQPLLERIAATGGSQRLELIILLDQLGDSGASPGLKLLLDKRKGAERDRNDPERLALEIALSRR